MSILPRKYRVGDPRNGEDLTPEMKAFDRANAKDRKRMIRQAFAEERAEFEDRQLSLLDWIEAQPATSVTSIENDALAAMRDILKQYHLSAVAGSAAMQLDAIDEFRKLARTFQQAMQDPGMRVADVEKFLFGTTAAMTGEEILFGQAFVRVVDLGPCRARLEFSGFHHLGLGMKLHAVDEGPFISSTGFRSCSVMFLGWGVGGERRVHFLEGKSVLDYMTELAVAGLDRVKKTGELKVVPWQPFVFRMPAQKREDADVAA